MAENEPTPFYPDMDRRLHGMLTWMAHDIRGYVERHATGDALGTLEWLAYLLERVPVLVEHDRKAQSRAASATATEATK